MTDFASVRPSRRFFTPGIFALIGVMLVGYGVAAVRFVSGLGPVTNLSDAWPWGLWIAVDVAAGVALAAGGFTTAALVHVAGRSRYRSLERPALLTAWLGYALVGLGLLLDLGRWQRMWHPVVYWQGNSVLFEVAMCVMFYLLVLTVEFAPVALSGFIDGTAPAGAPWTRLRRHAVTAREALRRVMPAFIIAGIVLSFMHQSALGTLLLIAPSKMSPLFFTPVLPVHFLLSAIMVGFPVVIFEGLLSARALHRSPDMDTLSSLARFVPVFLALYAVVRVADFLFRGGPFLMPADPVRAASLLAEFTLGTLVPLVLLQVPAVRRSPRGLLLASSLVIAGVVANRINVYLVARTPSHGGTYFPSIGEIAVTAALIATIVCLYRVFIHLCPVLPGDATPAGPVPPDTDRAVRLPALVLRMVAALVILSFIGLYAVAHGRALQPAVPPRHVHPPGVEEGDFYETARFFHGAHAARQKGDCTSCHHRQPRDEGDRTGEPLNPSLVLSRRMEDSADLRPVACGHCHGALPEISTPLRPGLRAALHRQCIGCHEASGGPVDCKGCHPPHVPQHQHHMDGIPLTDTVAAIERCRECHAAAADDFRRSTHGRQKGRQQSDCLTCHLQSDGASIGRPDRAVCLSCHFDGTRAAAVAADVHLGTAGMPCQDCHSAHRHEFRKEVRCATCHGEAPHGHARPTGPHLDAHGTQLACTDCHTGTDSSPFGTHHAILPAKHAAACTDCHEPPDIDCAGCHDHLPGEWVSPSP